MSRYDWAEIQRFYDLGHTREECTDAFGFSNGAWHHAVKRGRLVLREEGPRRPRRVTREAVDRLLGSGMTQAQIAAELNVCRSTVCFHMRNLGVDAAPEPARRFDWVAIRAHYDAGHSFRESQEAFGFSRNAWADAVDRGAIVPRSRLEPIEQILAAGRRRNRGHVKGRLLLAELKEARCEDCGIAKWRSRPIALELHHINGDGQDNRLENLRLLCPNCHSQTDTWGGRNKGRREDRTQAPGSSVVLGR